MQQQQQQEANALGLTGLPDVCLVDVLQRLLLRDNGEGAAADNAGVCNVCNAAHAAGCTQQQQWP
jgi:hypothetical protein